MKKYFFLLLTLFCVVQFVPNAYSQQKKRSNMTNAELREEIKRLKAELDDLNSQIPKLEYQFELLKKKRPSAKEMIHSVDSMIKDWKATVVRDDKIIGLDNAELVKRGVENEIQKLAAKDFNRKQIDSVTRLIYNRQATFEDYYSVIEVYQIHPTWFTEQSVDNQTNLMIAYNDQLKKSEEKIRKNDKEQETIVLNLCNMWKEKTGFRPDPQKTDNIIYDYMTKKTDNVKALMFQINKLNPDSSFNPNHPQYQALEEIVDASAKYYQHQEKEAVKSEKEVNSLQNALKDLKRMCPACAQKVEDKGNVNN